MAKWEGKYSPWGIIDHKVEVAPGAWRVGTPGHGGYKLSSYRNRKVHPIWRHWGGWYEEDLDWCIPVLTFDDMCENQATFELALDMAMNHYPYEQLMAFGDRWKSISESSDLCAGDFVEWLPKVGAEHLPDTDLERIYSSLDPLSGDEHFHSTDRERGFSGDSMPCLVTSQRPRWVKKLGCWTICYDVLSAAGHSTVQRAYLATEADKERDVREEEERKKRREEKKRAEEKKEDATG